jgi:benzoyl-CoA 2,3-epoxidase subunit B
METPDGIQDVPMRNAMNFHTRTAYIRDCQVGLTRWNRVIAKAGFDFELRLPSERFNRLGGLWVGSGCDVEGKPASPDAIIAALPSDADRIYVKSLMVAVTEIGKCANWIAPPDRGINNMAFDYDYVRAN